MKLSQNIGDILTSTQKNISVAESCTGGLISAAITSNPGSSQYFELGMVTYSNKAKCNLVHVSLNTLEKYGAVSKETAVEMASGIRKVAPSVYGLSATGIAGPGGATGEKPVGLVYIAFVSPQQSIWRELRLKGSREEIREQTVDAALSLIFDCMREE